jgi:phosphate transport system permease protein
VIGGANSINISLFAPADTLGSRIAAQYQGATSQLPIGAILYLGVILMVISLVTNVIAQLIVRRFERTRRAY